MATTTSVPAVSSAHQDVPIPTPSATTSTSVVRFISRIIENAFGLIRICSLDICRFFHHPYDGRSHLDKIYWSFFLCNLLLYYWSFCNLHKILSNSVSWSFFLISTTGELSTVEFRGLNMARRSCIYLNVNIKSLPPFNCSRQIHFPNPSLVENRLK